MSLGSKIKEQRKKLGITQPELANRIGMSLDSVKKMETDKMTPSLETFEKLIELFDVSADHLLNKQGKNDHEIDINTGLAKVGLVRHVTAGKETYGEYDSYVWVDLKLLKGLPALAYKLQDDSMSGDNIMRGDIAVMVKRHNFTPNDLMFVVVDEKMCIRRITKDEGLYILTASNTDYPPIVKGNNAGESFSIIGRVVQVIRNID